MRHLHTAVADAIREASNGDPEMAAEMRAESQEYANEVRGFYDYDDDPADFDDRDGPDEEPEFDEDEEEYDEAEGSANYDGPEDLGWDGGMEE